MRDDCIYIDGKNEEMKNYMGPAKVGSKKSGFFLSY